MCSSSWFGRHLQLIPLLTVIGRGWQWDIHRTINQCMHSIHKYIANHMMWITYLAALRCSYTLKMAPLCNISMYALSLSFILWTDRIPWKQGNGLLTVCGDSLHSFGGDVGSEAYSAKYWTLKLRITPFDFREQSRSTTKCSLFRQCRFVKVYENNRSRFSFAWSVHLIMLFWKKSDLKEIDAKTLDSMDGDHRFMVTKRNESESDSDESVEWLEWLSGWPPVWCR